MALLIGTGVCTNATNEILDVQRDLHANDLVLVTNTPLRFELSGKERIALRSMLGGRSPLSFDTATSCVGAMAVAMRAMLPTRFVLLLANFMIRRYGITKLVRLVKTVSPHFRAAPARSRGILCELADFTLLVFGLLDLLFKDNKVC